MQVGLLASAAKTHLGRLPVSGQGLFDSVFLFCSAYPAPLLIILSVCFALDMRNYPNLSAQSGQGVEHTGLMEFGLWKPFENADRFYPVRRADGRMTRRATDCLFAA